MTNQITSILYPILYTCLTALLAYLSREVIKIMPHIVNFIIAKIGLTNYQKTKAIAWDIWNVVEEHFRISMLVGDMVEAKATLFTSLIKQKLPGITDDEIELFRQAIAGEFNKDKPVIEKELETPIQEITVVPIIKYKTPDGIELKPVEEAAIIQPST